jgi:hypothetical protein
MIAGPAKGLSDADNLLARLTYGLRVPVAAYPEQLRQA